MLFFPSLPCKLLRSPRFPVLKLSNLNSLSKLPLSAPSIASLHPTIHRQYTNMAPALWTPSDYPSARRSDHIDTWKSEKSGQVKVHDPYEWLESYTEETDKWEL